MNVAARGLMTTGSRAAIDRMLDARLYGEADKAAMFDIIESSRRRYAALINADPDEIAITKNVSEGLNAIIASYDWQRGDNAVICPDLEHPNNVFPWRNLAKRTGMDVKTVAPHDGQISVEAIAEAIDGNTRMVTASSVTFAPGFRTDIAAIARLCRERDILFLVDGVQSVGILHTDVNELGIDAMAVSTQKGLLGLYGMGFLYCRREWAERLTPVYLARFGVDMGDAHEAALGDGDDRLAPGARRFDLGNYNFVAAAAVDDSIGMMLDTGTREIEEYVTGLTRDLATGLLDVGLPVVGGEPGPATGSIVSVGSIGEGQHDTVDDPAMAGLHDYLSANGVNLSIRRGILRFSLHLYNDASDVARVIELARGHNA
ncbi:MAG: aminotransferase class V-fold PLP-dependent enzyme [Proteobacteria bacterium]|nr:aminotransferase class V-fold PLP-dependent enzyme [Pseudomonadota bacterium]